MNKVPEGILIIEDYLDPAQIKEITDYVDFQIGNMAMVGKREDDGTVTRIWNEFFEAERIELHAIEAPVKAICEDVFSRQVADFYGVEIEWYEFPHVLRYRKGGTYAQHSDSETWDEASQSWEKGIDRDFSAIIYINDQFTGGQLYFPKFDYHVEPKPGMLICFPSDSRFLHGAEPTLSGKRYALVTWSAAKGSSRVSKRPADIVFFD